MVRYGESIAILTVGRPECNQEYAEAVMTINPSIPVTLDNYRYLLLALLPNEVRIS